MTTNEVTNEVTDQEAYEGKPSSVTKTKTKAAKAAQAKAKGRKFFLAICERHSKDGKRVRHYASTRKCVQCRAEKNAERDELLRAGDTATVAGRRAQSVNDNTVQRLRKAGRPGPSSEALKECLEIIKAAPVGAEIDHAVPLKGFNATGEWVVSGLHVAWNLEPMQKRSNRVKSNIFDPDRLWFQRPYNSFPGGQLHGEIGEIEFMRYTVDGGVALELMTEGEFRLAIINGAEASNAEMFEEARKRFASGSLLGEALLGQGRVVADYVNSSPSPSSQRGLR